MKSSLPQIIFTCISTGIRSRTDSIPRSIGARTREIYRVRTYTSYPSVRRPELTRHCRFSVRHDAAYNITHAITMVETSTPHRASSATYVTGTCDERERAVVPLCKRTGRGIGKRGECNGLYLDSRSPRLSHLPPRLSYSDEGPSRSPLARNGTRAALLQSQDFSIQVVADPRVSDPSFNPFPSFRVMERICKLVYNLLEDSVGFDRFWLRKRCCCCNMLFRLKYRGYLFLRGFYM